MANHLVKIRAWRLAKQIPCRTMVEWRRAWFNGGQVISLCLAILTSYIGLQTASLPKIIDEAEGWGQAIQATIYVAAAWLLVCFVRAPYLIWSDDKALGIWHGNRYVYHQKHLVGTFHCKPTGGPQTFPVRLPHAAPRAFVHYEIQVGNGRVPTSLYTATLTGSFILSSMLEPGRGATSGGTTIGADQCATLLMTMKAEAISQTVRVYCLDFSIGNPEDKGGEEGTPWGRA